MVNKGSEGKAQVNMIRKSLIKRTEKEIRVSALASLLREEEEKMSNILGWKLKVVERGGRPLKSILTKTNLFSDMGCGRSKCEACKNATKPLNCRRRSILYETACKDCIENDIEGAVYVGESARSGAERIGKHVDDAESEKKDSHMFKHWSTQHGGEKTSFSFKIISFFSSPLKVEKLPKIMREAF